MVPSLEVYEPDCAPETGPYIKFPAPSVIYTQSQLFSVAPPNVIVISSVIPSLS